LDPIRAVLTKSPNHHDTDTRAGESSLRKARNRILPMSLESPKKKARGSCVVGKCLHDQHRDIVGCPGRQGRADELLDHALDVGAFHQ
jgi:hypothetical protein